MRRELNVVGSVISRLRSQRGWSQDDLVAKLQIQGCYMTRDILANIESKRSPVSDLRMLAFCDVFKVEMNELFPTKEELARARIQCAKSSNPHRIVTRKCKSCDPKGKNGPK